jgi:hypothetical protein
LVAVEVVKEGAEVRTEETVVVDVGAREGVEGRDKTEDEYMGRDRCEDIEEEEGIADLAEEEEEEEDEEGKERIEGEEAKEREAYVEYMG